VSATTWGVLLTAGAAVLLVLALVAVVRAKQAESDVSGIFRNASVALYLVAWACPMLLFGLALLGVEGPGILAPAFVVLGGLGAAFLIASAAVTFLRKKKT
jgi:hypothetical protein